MAVNNHFPFISLRSAKRVSCFLLVHKALTWAHGRCRHTPVQCRGREDDGRAIVGKAGELARDVPPAHTDYMLQRSQGGNCGRTPTDRVGRLWKKGIPVSYDNVRTV